MYAVYSSMHSTQVSFHRRESHLPIVIGLIHGKSVCISNIAELVATRAYRLMLRYF